MADIENTTRERISLDKQNKNFIRLTINILLKDIIL